jgi:hypothetical protein
MRTPGPSYVVRDQRALRSLLVVTVLSLVVAGLLVVATGQWVGPAVAVVVIGYLAADRLRAVREQLRVDGSGISAPDPEARGRRRARGYVPWDAVREVEVDGDLLVVRLRPDAPMPMWLKGRVVDPVRPEDATELRRRLPALDAVQLQRVVHDLGVDVPVVVR